MEVNTKEYSCQSTAGSSYLSKNLLARIGFKDYLSVLKLGIVLPNLLMAVIGMWLAASGPIGFFSLSIRTISFSIVGIFMILASGTSFNNYFDQDIDQLMKRTSERVLAQGKIPAGRVLLISIAMLIVGMAFLSAVNVATAAIALAGWIGYAVIYTVWFKRRHWVNTIVGSFSGAVPPVIGWVAASGHLAWGGFILFIIMFLWQPPHFYAIAIKRREDYENAGIPMLPVVKGFETTQKHILVSIILLIPATILLYIFTKMNSLYLFLAIILGVGWLLQARWNRAKEYKESDMVNWSQKNFIYSLIYLVALMIAMFIGSF